MGESEGAAREAMLAVFVHADDLYRDVAGLGILFGMALVPVMVNAEAEVGVDVRGRREIFQLVKPPFVDTSVKES